jgi:hypothetical protein
VNSCGRSRHKARGPMIERSSPIPAPFITFGSADFSDDLKALSIMHLAGPVVEAKTLR